MSQCECLAGCPFFNDKMDNMPAMADIYKARYCTGDPGICARYQVFKAHGKGAVPSNLYPNDGASVPQILADLGGRS